MAMLNEQIIGHSRMYYISLTKKMKTLIWKLVLPLTLITFFLFTKWWYVFPIDGPDTMMAGFPLIWVSYGWHTSLSLQIFVGELLINLFIYFSTILAITYAINRFVIKISIPKIATGILLTISGLLCLAALWIGTMPEHIYKTKRDFDVEVLTTGYKFIWEAQERPRYEDYKID